MVQSSACKSGQLLRLLDQQRLLAGWINGDCCWLDQRRLLVGGSTEIAGWWIEGIFGWWINGDCWLVRVKPRYLGPDRCLQVGTTASTLCCKTQLSFALVRLCLHLNSFEIEPSSLQQLRTIWCFRSSQATLPWYRPLLARRYNCFDSSCRDLDQLSFELVRLFLHFKLIRRCS